MSRVLPILFNTEMVRAILDGRKTVTRRVMKPQPQCSIPADCRCLGCKGAVSGICNKTDLDFPKQPYQLGDILYVRESGIIQSMKNYDKIVKIYFLADDTLHEFAVTPDEYERLSKFPEDKKLSPYWLTKQESRIWLKVTDVRVERLQDISYMDCIHEGVLYKQIERNVISNFSKVWDSTIKKSDRDRYGWDANPWVWVIEFERCEKPEMEDE